MLYPQSIQGKYRNIKNYVSYLLLSIYFISPWLRWDRGENNPSQAIILELENRRAFFFGIEIWPQELYYLTGILIIAAIGLFFATSLFGRIWCGYTCPHTVYVDLFFKVQRFFQGDRNSMIKLDSMAWTSEKIRKKALTHGTWLALSFMFAFGWVCYFYDAPQLVSDILHFQISYHASLWILGLTCTTYYFGGFLRDKVCIYMCPYGRFQSAMVDENSTLVTYKYWRGEPRGPLKEDGNGDCIDCGKCVHVCPMGIDIRDGLQLACIGCGLCVDACNSVMEKINKPLNLISYESDKSIESERTNGAYKRAWLNSKILIFSIIIFMSSSAMLYALLTKPDFSFNISKSRSSMFTLLPDGSYRNTYDIKLFNLSLKSRTLTIQVKYGDSNLELKTQGYNQDYFKEIKVILKKEEIKNLVLYSKFYDKVLTDSVYFVIHDDADDKTYKRKITFLTGE